MYLCKRFSLLLPALLFFISCAHPRLQKTLTRHVPVSQNEVDSGMVKAIQPYKQNVDAKMNEVIGFAPEALVKNLPESNLGNFFSDAMYFKAKQIPGVDTAKLVVIFNTGGLRTSIPQGNVKVGNMFELMPFENELVFLTLKGAKLLNVLNFIAEKGGAPIAGLQMRIEEKKATGIYIHQAALDTAVTYTIGTSDYLANGGDKIFNPGKPGSYIKTNILVRDILIERCRTLTAKNNPVTARTDGRISITK